MLYKMMWCFPRSQTPLYILIKRKQIKKLPKDYPPHGASNNQKDKIRRKQNHMVLHVISQLIIRKQYHMVPNAIPQLITRKQCHTVLM